MVLSGPAIERLVAKGKLQILGAQEDSFQQNGVDLRLGPEIGVLTQHTRWTDGEPRVRPARGLKLFRSGRCYLAHTVEQLVLPSNLAGFVELRSSWARRGLLLPPTMVDAGFCGDLTLEIFVGGPGCRVPYGERFAHVVFVRVEGPPRPYRGKYQHQRGVTPAKRD